MSFRRCLGRGLGRIGVAVQGIGNQIVHVVVQIAFEFAWDIAGAGHEGGAGPGPLWRWGWRHFGAKARAAHDGYLLEASGVQVPFGQLPEETQRFWDCAANAVFEILVKRYAMMPLSERLEDIARLESQPERLGSGE